jgi:surface protein
MTKQLINESTLTNIADAIRDMEGVSVQMYPSEMPSHIRNIPSSAYHYEIPAGRPDLSTFEPHNTTEYALYLYMYGDDIFTYYGLKPNTSNSSHHAQWYIYGYSSADEEYTLLYSFTTAGNIGSAYTDDFISGLPYDYMLIEIVPQELNAHLKFVQVGDVDQNVVARYMKLPSMTSVSVISLRGVEHDVWENISFNGSFSTVWARSRNLRCIELKNCTLSATNLSNAFGQCSQLRIIKGAENINTTNCTTMKSMFTDCYCMEDFDFLTNWNTAKVTDMENIFKNCSNVISLNLSNWNVAKVTTLFAAFYGMTRLKSLDLSGWTPNVVTTMKQLCYGCACLQEVKMPQASCSSLTTLEGAFQSCNTLQLVDLTDFYTPALTNVHYMFYQNYRLRYLDMSDMSLAKVTTLANGDFGIQVSTLRYIVFPDDMVILGNSAITTNKGLKEVTLPASVTTIGSLAFSTCSYLTSVTLLSNSLVTLSNVNAFENTPANLKIYVPASLVSTYQSATNWITLASQIEAIA